MKKRIVLFLLVTVLGLTACGGNDVAQNSVDEEQKLRIGLLRIDDSLPFYVAEQEGLFEKYGANVELIEFKSGKDQSMALESGELDGMMTDMVVQGLCRKSGVDMKTIAMALGANAAEGRFLVVSAPDSGIVTAEDLAGKTVAISNNTMMDYLMEQFETIEGLSDIQKVNMPDLMLRVTTLLEGRGDIDAAILPDPLAAYALLEGADSVIDDTALGVNLSQSVVAVTNESIKRQRDNLAKMIAAYNEAIERINNQPENYRQLCLEKANVPEALTENYIMPTFTANCLPTEEEVQRVTTWLFNRELTEKAYSYEEMVDDQFIDND